MNIEGLVETLREAADVLVSVGTMHGKDALPANWRWPLADELSGFAAILAASKAEAPDRVVVWSPHNDWNFIAERSKRRPTSTFDDLPTYETIDPIQPADLAASKVEAVAYAGDHEDIEAVQNYQEMIEAAGGEAVDDFETWFAEFDKQNHYPYMLAKAAWEAGKTAAGAVPAEVPSLREAIQDVAGRIMSRAKWEPCDCGCNSDKPVDAVSVAYVRAASMVRAALQGHGE